MVLKCDGNPVSIYTIVYIETGFCTPKIKHQNGMTPRDTTTQKLGAWAGAALGGEGGGRRAAGGGRRTETAAAKAKIQKTYYYYYHYYYYSTTKVLILPFNGHATQ